MQIKHYLTKQGTAHTWTRPLTTLENLCFQTSPQRHTISILSLSLFGELNDFTSTSCLAWKRDLNIQMTLTEWETIFMYAHKGSLNVATEECGYKIIICWYRTPTLLNKFYPQVPNRCWRCSMVHIWWSCPMIQTYWHMVNDAISTVTSEDRHSTFFTTIKFLKNFISNSYLCL